MWRRGVDTSRFRPALRDHAWRERVGGGNLCDAWRLFEQSFEDEAGNPVDPNEYFGEIEDEYDRETPGVESIYVWTHSGNTRMNLVNRRLGSVVVGCSAVWERAIGEA